MSYSHTQLSNVPTITTDIYPVEGAIRRGTIRITAITNTKPETCVQVKFLLLINKQKFKFLISLI